MEQNTKAYEQVRTLTDLLNQYRHEYYNLSAPSVSDKEYDRLFDALAALEKETGIVMSNSPTQTVGYPSVSELPKTTHTIPLLSMDKVKNEELSEQLQQVGAVGEQVASGTGNVAEAVSALVVLGYSQSEAARAVAGQPPEASVQELIKVGLKKLSGAR